MVYPRAAFTAYWIASDQLLRLSRSASCWVIALADAVRETSAAAVTALHDLGVKAVILSGDNEATAKRLAAQLGIDTVSQKYCPRTRPPTSPHCNATCERSPWSATASAMPQR